MASDYPANYDELGLPGPTDKLDDPDVQHDQEHVAVAEAAMATQHALGLNPQGGYPTVRARLDALEESGGGTGGDGEFLPIVNPAARGTLSVEPEEGSEDAGHHRYTVRDEDTWDEFAVDSDVTATADGGTRARGTLDAPTAVELGDILRYLWWREGHDGTGYSIASVAYLQVDDDVSEGIVPTALVVEQCDAAGVFTETFRIASDGTVTAAGLPSGGGSGAVEHVAHGSLSGAAPSIDDVFDTSTGLWRVVLSNVTAATADYFRAQGRLSGVNDTGSCNIVYVGSNINGATTYAGIFLGRLNPSVPSLIVMEITNPAAAVGSVVAINQSGAAVQINSANTPANIYDGLGFFTDSGYVISADYDVFKIAQS
jgi:hypothetical protein